MDKIKLHSRLKNIVSQSILDNNFDNTLNTFNPQKFYGKERYRNNNVVIDITSFGTNISVNPTIYIKGNNIEQVTNQELKEFIEKFETDLKINSDYLNLTGFDFNSNIYTNYKPKNYLNLFRILPKYDKTIHKRNTGITFKNDCKEFIFYDKKIEQENKKIIIPIEYENKNILRIELSIKEKMKQTKNLQNLNSLKDCTTKNNYNNIVKEHLKMYKKINKQQTNLRIRNINLVEIPNMDIEDESILYHINDIGMQEYFNKIDNRINLNFISNKQGKARKEKALSIWNKFLNYSDNDKYDLLTEINTKVNDTAMALME